MFNNIWKHNVKNKDIGLEKTESEHNTDNIGLILLSELECGKSARVVKLQGNSIQTDKLSAMGIFVGTIILKKSALPSKGPIIIEKGSMQFALGYEIAKNIIVELCD